jgi:hypothetical protein
MTRTRNWVSNPQVSDEAVASATGRGWSEWIELLDAWGARERSHAAIARHLTDELAVDGWWAQSVTVGYERIRGKRKTNQRPDGYSMNASKTVPVPVTELFDWFIDGRKRVAWLGEDVLRVRTANSPRSGRFDIVDGGGILAAHFIDKGEKSTVQLQLNAIESEEVLEEQKRLWRSRLTDLAERIDRSRP